MTSKIQINCQIPAAATGQRLDVVLAQLLPQYSRSRIQQWIKQGEVLLEGKRVSSRYNVLGLEQVNINATLPAEVLLAPEAIPLDIVFEDPYLLVINKPKNWVVHPGAGNADGTLLNALLHHEPALLHLPRAGIVHRLDKDTTGLLVVAKRLEAHHQLVKALQAREIKREYLAIVNGQVTAGGIVDAAMGRHPRQRTRMAVVSTGKRAVTRYQVKERFTEHTLLQVELETGRTHQIRVHMAHLHHPLLGDVTYGARPRYPRGASATLREAIDGFNRQALHAFRLSLAHPMSGEWLSWEAPVPEDFQLLWGLLSDS